MPNQAGDDGIHLKFLRWGHMNKRRVFGSDGSRFLMQQTFSKGKWGWKSFKWEWMLYDYSNNKQGEELFKMYYADSRWWQERHGIPLVLEDLRPGGLGTFVPKIPKWAFNGNFTMKFDFDGRTYLWTWKGEGLRLIAYEEKDLKEKQRTIFVKHKLSTQEIRIYNAGSHLPPVLVIITGLAMQQKIEDRTGDRRRDPKFPKSEQPADQLM